MQRIEWFKFLAILMTAALLAACGGANESMDASSEPVIEQATAVTVSEQSNDVAQEAAPVTQDGFRTFLIVPGETTASYIVQEEFFAGALSKLGINAGKTTVTGSTDKVEGQLQLALGSENPLGENRFTVNVNTFATEQDRRDTWIKENGPSFNSFPSAEFVATAIEGAPTNYTDDAEVTFTLRGDLTIRDITKNVAFVVAATLAVNTITGVATTPSKLTDWGIEPPNFANTLTVADEFEIQLTFTAREP